MAEPRVFVEFDTLDEAKAYRKRTGCGGWIYDVHGPEPKAILFPPKFTLTPVMTHRIVRGCWGMMHG
jgi:hypothetical protein